ncbi:MAG TPA: phosphotransferase [Acidimicrobiales bacterium]|nr:phosphotransferase [Acidimicrobiales bacterium]
MVSPSEPASVAERLAASLAPLLGPVEVANLERLSGGASRETWAFRAGGRDLVLRRDPPGRPGPPGSMALEAAAIRAAHRAGLAAPEILLADDGTSLGTAGLVMERVPGETIARRILREDGLAGARERLTSQLGTFLGRLHRVDPAEVPGLVGSDPLETYWAVYQLVADESPTFEATYDWLVDHRPPPPARAVIVHGDLRLGNLVVGPEGLRAVLDWELVHLGDPLEDLAWLCTKAWRFGAPLPVAGVGELGELFGAYERASGDGIDATAFHWWLVLSTLKWGIMCMGQAAAHLSGASRSIELAAIGRRVAEQEWDLIELVAPGEWEKARAAAPRAAFPDEPGPYGRPTARELLEAVREFLAGRVVPETSGQLSFHARVAANAVAIVERELSLGIPRATPPCGERDWAVLATAVRDRLEVANPKALGSGS